MTRLMKSLVFALLLAAAATLLLTASVPSVRAKSYNAIERRNMLIIGDRVVDIAYHLGVLPSGMSVRCSLWPLCERIKVVSRPLGCPGCLSGGDHDKVIKFVKANQVKLALVEKSSPFCLMAKEADPMDGGPVLRKLGVEVKVVDFGQGVAQAIRQTAAALGLPEKGRALAAQYEQSVKKTAQKIAGQKLNKRVVILHGIYQGSSGKSFVQVEAPGGYSDAAFLKPLGCVNVGAALVPAGKKPSKGRWTVRKLDKLASAKPDVVVITGDSAAVQKKLNQLIATQPRLCGLPVISLPVYIGGSVIEEPAMKAKWFWALK